MHVWFFFVLFLVAGCLVELTVATKPRLRTWFSWRASLIRATLFGAFYAFWLAATFQRPVFAAILASVTLGFFVAVSRAKEFLLKEPLVFLDLQFVGQVFRHPRLYYSQVLHSPRILLAVCASLVVAVSVVAGLLWHERPLSPGFPGVVVALFLAGPFILCLAPRLPCVAERTEAFLAKPARELNPGTATERWGLFVPMFAHYCRWLREEHRNASGLPLAPSITGASNHLPHIVAIQCESFVDPARFFRDAPDLPAFRAAQRSALTHGALCVPAGGAYTMRTEFSFLTGLAPDDLGCDRYNPYARATRRDDPSLAKTLLQAGYQSDFVHPHDLRFFRRDAVMPALGFRSLHGPEKFGEEERRGPHVSDAAVARYIAQLLRDDRDPRFVFAVTMENHGPWMPDRLPGGRFTARELYFHHLQGCDRMISLLLELTMRPGRPVIVCFYGDHAPVLDYDFTSESTPLTDYFIATSGTSGVVAERRDRSVDELPKALLRLLEAELNPAEIAQGNNAAYAAV